MKIIAGPYTVGCPSCDPEVENEDACVNGCVCCSRCQAVAVSQ